MIAKKQRGKGGATAPPAPPAPKAERKIYQRFIAACEFLVSAPDLDQARGIGWVECPFNKREEPRLHDRPSAARREAILHALEARHVKVVEVGAHRITNPEYKIVPTP